MLSIINYIPAIPTQFTLPMSIGMMMQLDFSVSKLAKRNMT